MPLCHLCGLKLNKSIRTLENDLKNQNLTDGQIKDYKKLLLPTRDHLIPKSLGGANTKTNLKMAHAFCNSKRQNIPVLFFRMLFLLTNGAILKRHFSCDDVLNSEKRSFPFPKKILNSLKVV